MRSRLVIAVASALAVVSYAAQAQQQGSVSNSRLMFDPSSLGPPGSPPQIMTAPAPRTTGQSAQQQPAARQVIVPQPQAAAPAPKPAARTTAAAPAKPAPARRAAPTERAINDTTAGQTSTGARPVPREQQTLGRVPLPQGSLGYEGKTQMQTYDMSDGRRVPGFENIQRNDSSYFGLSLRMPTFGSSSSPASSSPSSYSPSPFGSHGPN
jgi:hypothetical protein